ncbi:Transcription initiation factor TFIID subunit 15 [Glycine max]|nr:Transcription initiation factor TFIID subunit 15 [Glycine max]
MATNPGNHAPSNGSVYVCNLPYGTNDIMLVEYFGTIGLIKVWRRPKIWLYRDKETNEPKGDATVTYEDPHAVVEWFNNILVVSENKVCDMKLVSSSFLLFYSLHCSNVNFAFRGACNHCGTARPAGASGISGAGGRGKGCAAQESGGIGRPAGGGLFGPNDWPCPMCGNINWAKRTKCNICNTNKPGHNEGGVRIKL